MNCCKKCLSTLFVLSTTGLCGSACATIEPGQVGVLWRAFGGGTQREAYGEGVQAVAPWNHMNVYDQRVMSRKEQLNVIAMNGLAVKLDTSVIFRLAPKEVVALQEEVGPNYYAKILEPVLRSEARRIVGRYTPEDIYSTHREDIEREIRQGIGQKIKGKHIELEAVLIRNVELPEPIRKAIDQKLAEEQEVERMRFVLAVAKANAEKKEIEADALATYNKKVGATLTPEILEYEKVDQLTQLARSENAKVVLVGPGVGSPPVLLSTRP